MIGDIFVCFPKKPYNYLNMKKTFVFVLLFLTSVSGFAQNYKLYTLFIFSFTRYIQWPEAYSQGDFEIIILGDSPVIEDLKAMAQAKKVGDRAIKVTRINSPAEIRKCNILFVPAAKSAQLPEVLAKVNTQSILVVTEENGLASKGSNINFILKDGKVAFELNQSTVSRQNMKVSNELSRLAILI
jgi:hypothetical protein